MNSFGNGIFRDPEGHKMSNGSPHEAWLKESSGLEG